jgi:hypothetical protein
MTPPAIAPELDFFGGGADTMRFPFGSEVGVVLVDGDWDDLDDCVVSLDEMLFVEDDDLGSIPGFAVDVDCGWSFSDTSGIDRAAPTTVDMASLSEQANSTTLVNG